MIHLAGLAAQVAASSITLGEALSAAVPTLVGVVIVALVRVTYGKIDESIRGLGARVDLALAEVGAGKVADAEIRARLVALEREVEDLRVRRRGRG